MVDVIYKKCVKCWVTKELNSDNFHKNKYHKNWFRSRCKICEREYYKEHKEQMNNYEKKYYQKNKEEIKKRTIEHARITWQDKLHKRTNRFIKKYNLRPNTCSICWSKEFIYAHHPSNDVRNEVILCCKSCHQRIHSWDIQWPKSIDLLKLI